MSAPAVDERLHWDALEALLTATLGADRVFKHGDVPGLDGNPGTVPPIFALLVVQRRRAAPAKSSRRADTSGWRVSVRYVGRTVDEAAWAALRVTEALEDVRLSVDSHTTTPLTHDSMQAIGPDKGLMSGQSSWSYAI